MSEFDKLLRNVNKQRGLKELSKNHDVMLFISDLELSFTRQALSLDTKATDADRFQALIARDAIQKLARLLNRSSELEKLIEEKILKHKIGKESIS